MTSVPTSIQQRQRSSKIADFQSAGEILSEILATDEGIAEVLGSSELDGCPISPETEMQIIRTQINSWAMRRLPLFAGRAA